MDSIGKTLRRTLPLVLMLCTATAAVAQKMHFGDQQATIQAMRAVIKKHPRNFVEPFVNKVCSKYKNNVEVLTGAADAFWYNGRDSANAFRYAEKALLIDSTYVPAYTLVGDIWAVCEDTTKAMSWFGRAITANSSNPEGYVRMADMYASSDHQAAFNVLSKAKTAIPTFPLNIKLARMYNLRMEKGVGDLTENMNNVTKYYSTAFADSTEKDSMIASDYSEFARQSYGLGRLDKNNYVACLNIAEEGLTHFANDSSLLRLAYYSAVETNNGKKGVEYGDRLKETEKVQFNNTDLRYYGRAYMVQHKLTAAIKTFEELLASPTATDEDRNYAIGKIGEAYKELGEYDRAESIYADYVAQREKAGQLTVADLNGYAQLYVDKAAEENGLEKEVSLMKADSVYAIMGQKFLSYAPVIEYQRFVIRHTLDPEQTRGLALPIAKSYISLVSSKAEKTESERKNLGLMYRYIASYYFRVENNTKKSRPYWEKAYEYDPEDNYTRKVLTLIFKMKLE